MNSNVWVPTSFQSPDVASEPTDHLVRMALSGMVSGPPTPGYCPQAKTWSKGPKKETGRLSVDGETRLWAGTAREWAQVESSIQHMAGTEPLESLGCPWQIGPYALKSSWWVKTKFSTVSTLLTEKALLFWQAFPGASPEAKNCIALCT